jgi:NADH-quinone oxidoreductase subunit E
MKESSTDYLRQLIRKWKGKEGNLVMILHEIQDNYGYVPREVSMDISEELEIPLARIYEVITFYNYFKLTPPAKHHIAVCMGTACYLRGAPEILQEIKNVLQVEQGQVTRDGNFMVDTVRCLGCCGLAPVVNIDGKIYGKLKRSDVMETLSRYMEGAEKVAVR